MLSIKQGSIKYHFWVFGMTQPGMEPRSPSPLANTQTIMPMSGFKYSSQILMIYAQLNMVSVIDWLILTAGQPILDYFVPIG